VFAEDAGDALRHHDGFLAGTAREQRGVNRGEDLRQGETNQGTVLVGIVEEGAVGRALPQFSEGNPNRAGGQLDQRGFDGDGKSALLVGAEEGGEVGRKRGQNWSERNGD
jgi:hypothetical protein